MNSIAKAQGFKLGPETGLITRDTGKFITKDPDEIAQIFLGSNSSAADLKTVESIMRALQKDPDMAVKTADARDNFASRGLDLDSVSENL